jgi:hypothetical protein
MIGRYTLTLVGHSDLVFSVSFSSDGNTLCHVTITSQAPFARIETGRARLR